MIEQHIRYYSVEQYFSHSIIYLYIPRYLFKENMMTTKTVSSPYKYKRLIPA